jgi:hypothetical protein
LIKDTCMSRLEVVRKFDALFLQSFSFNLHLKINDIHIVVTCLTKNGQGTTDVILCSRVSWEVWAAENFHSSVYSFEVLKDFYILSVFSCSL